MPKWGIDKQQIEAMLPAVGKRFTMPDPITGKPHWVTVVGINRAHGWVRIEWSGTGITESIRFDDIKRK